MQCRSVLLRIDQFRTGELPAEETVKIEEHLERCTWCDDSYHELESIASQVRELARNAPANTAAPELTDGFGEVDTPAGTFRVAFSSKGITMIGRAGDPDETFANSYRSRFGRGVVRADVPERYRRQVAEAVAGNAPASPDVDISELPEFERTVLASLLEIPHGEVRPYAWIARKVGRPKAVRAVGNICARNPVPFVVPCHRVVPSEGGVGNYGFGSAMKRELLEREGVPVSRIEELKRKHVRFVGSRTTGIFCFPTCPDARRIREENQIHFRDERDAVQHGYRSCRRCRPLLTA